MDLREFVKDTILEVIRGVHAAADSIREAHSAEGLRGAVIQPADATTSGIEFDVAVTVSGEAEAGLGLRVPLFIAGASTKLGEQRTNRISFTVPVAFAAQPVGPEHTITAAPAPPPALDSPQIGFPGPSRS
jgi:hypothetical protein